MNEKIVFKLNLKILKKLPLRNKSTFKKLMLNNNKVSSKRLLIKINQSQKRNFKFLLINRMKKVFKLIVKDALIVRKKLGYSVFNVNVDMYIVIHIDYLNNMNVFSIIKKLLNKD